MAGADRFLNGLNRIRKKRAENSNIDMQAELLRAFTMSIPPLADALTHDLFNYFFEKALRDPKDILDAARDIADVIDLFELDHDSSTNTITAEDWEYIRDSVSDAALDMPEDILTYVLSIVVDQGLFDSH